MVDIKISQLIKDQFSEAVELVLNAELDTREEIEHHLEDIEAHYVAMLGDKIVGVIGWYQDNVNYAKKAMGDKFPGEDAYWVGFFAVDKQFQGKGIGTKLMSKLEKIVKEKKSTQLWVSSVPESETYYAAKGFELVVKGEISGAMKSFMVKVV